MCIFPILEIGILQGVWFSTLIFGPNWHLSWGIKQPQIDYCNTHSWRRPQRSLIYRPIFHPTGTLAKLVEPWDILQLCNDVPKSLWFLKAKQIIHLIHFSWSNPTSGSSECWLTPKNSTTTSSFSLNGDICSLCTNPESFCLVHVSLVVEIREVEPVRTGCRNDTDICPKTHLGFVGKHTSQWAWLYGKTMVENGIVLHFASQNNLAKCCEKHPTYLSSLGMISDSFGSWRSLRNNLESTSTYPLHCRLTWLHKENDKFYSKNSRTSSEPLQVCSWVTANQMVLFSGLAKWNCHDKRRIQVLGPAASSCLPAASFYEATKYDLHSDAVSVDDVPRARSPHFWIQWISISTKLGMLGTTNSSDLCDRQGWRIIGHCPKSIERWSFYAGSTPSKSCLKWESTKSRFFWHV